MPYQVLPHTADIRMKVSGSSLEQVFSDALAGMAAVQKKNLAPSQYTERSLALQAQDPTSLLVDFLNEALALSTIHKEVYPRFSIEKLTGNELLCRLQGVAVSEFDEDIKAVTYHEANLIKNQKGEWGTILVFDI